ncbi:hypothetical protein [Neorhodopirellula lusitana]|nr:hypothetical protein [Neorhodopirellula lusitana]
MPSSTPTSRNPKTASLRRYAFRIEKDRVMLAVGKMGEGEEVAIEIDCCFLNEQTPMDVQPEDADLVSPPIAVSDWLSGEGNKRLQAAIETLKNRHHIGSEEVAVSLSGDFCVTRISTGTVEQVDHELDALAGRIPRYLQLGPGGKLTGQIRDTLNPGIEHALTAVGNLTRLQTLYDAFAECDVRVAWIEPSLVSIARLIGELGIDEEHPVLVADSFGQSWEVGITHQGRLLLDYRPAAAHDAKTFANAIVEHLSRLRRFCQRHRGIDYSELNVLYVGGPPEKVDPVLEHFSEIAVQNDHGLRTLPLLISDSFITIEVEASLRSDAIAAAAALLPLIRPDSQQPPPDLLQTIRRTKQQGGWKWIALTWWPAIAATFVVVALHFWVGGLQSQAEQRQLQREYVENQLRANRVRVASLQSDRRWVDHLKTISEKTVSPPMADLTKEITQCLPPRSVLQSIQVESERDILLSGSTSQEAEIYEIVGYLRQLPGIHQVALLGTMLGSKQEESQFNIRLSWRPDTSISESSLAMQESSNE